MVMNGGINVNGKILQDLLFTGDMLVHIPDVLKILFRTPNILISITRLEVNLGKSQFQYITASMFNSTK